MLSIPGVSRDQVWYEQPPFYNSNFAKLNGSASLFGEAQLDCFAAMAPGSHSCRVQQSKGLWELLRIRGLTPSDA